jgi:hypothetical protein
MEYRANPNLPYTQDKSFRDEINQGKDTFDCPLKRYMMNVPENIPEELERENEKSNPLEKDFNENMFNKVNNN